MLSPGDLCCQLSKYYLANLESDTHESVIIRNNSIETPVECVTTLKAFRSMETHFHTQRIITSSNYQVDEYFAVQFSITRMSGVFVRIANSDINLFNYLFTFVQE